MTCNHTSFEAEVEVSGGRSTSQPTDRRGIKVRVRCAQCHQQLRFEESIGVYDGGITAMLQSQPLVDPGRPPVQRQPQAPQQPETGTSLPPWADSHTLPKDPTPQQ